MSGVRSETAAIWLSAVMAAVNFAFSFVGLYLVERIGRRPLTIASLIGRSHVKFTSSPCLALAYRQLPCTIL